LELLPYIVHLFSFIDTLLAELWTCLEVLVTTVFFLLLTDAVMFLLQGLDLCLMALAPNKSKRHRYSQE
jgi:hypothetical protein